MTKEQVVYVLVMERSDGQMLNLYASDIKKEVEDLHIKHTSMWADCVKSNLPYVLEEPTRRAFSPNLIKEILIESMTIDEWEAFKNNPYGKKAAQEGFGTTMDKYFKK